MGGLLDEGSTAAKLLEANPRALDRAGGGRPTGGGAMDGPPPARPPVLYRYGTAGFRTKTEVLDSVMVRTGMLAAIRARARPGLAIGVMVTASHNKEADNGVKITDFDGGMMNQSWESVATTLANAPERKALGVLRDICTREGLDLSKRAVVIVGEDTRATSPRLAGLVAAGARALGAQVTRMQPCTTPELHFAVWRLNVGGGEKKISEYYKRFSDAFESLSALAGSSPASPVPVYVDCANGVGAVAIEKVRGLVKSRLDLRPFNVDTKTPGKLNEGCGAEHVQKQKRLPAGVADAVGSAGADGFIFASIDGDADRIVFFSCSDTTTSSMALLDGDKITALLAGYIGRLLADANLDKKFSLGVVQTAYANGASTKYLEKAVGADRIACTKTGVKHLHHKALDYDVGVYFEANGHGTVVFSSKVQAAIATAAADTDTTAKAQTAARKLLALTQLINQAIGDALSDLLAVLAILSEQKWTLQDWNSLYSDLPSCMLKAKVADRTAVKTTNAERTCVEPKGLQARIDDLVREMGPSARSFVRPSGTEDVVRVYAEAATQDKADALAESVKKVVAEMLAA